MAATNKLQSLAVISLFFFSFVLHEIVPVGALMCVQCTPADTRCETGNLDATECEEGANFCGMYRVFVGSSQGVFRGCSSHYLRGCRSRIIDMKQSMVCYESCSWDSCNATPAPYNLR